MITIRNQNNQVIVDGSNPNFHLHNTFSMSGTDGGFMIDNPSDMSKLTFTRSDIPVFVGLAGVAGENPRIAWDASSSATPVFFRYGVGAPKTQSGTAGLRMLDPSGNVAFDSRAFPLRIRDVVTLPWVEGQSPGNSTLSRDPANSTPPSTLFTYNGGYPAAVLVVGYELRLAIREYQGTGYVFRERFYTVGNEVYTVFQFWYTQFAAAGPGSWTASTFQPRLLLANVQGHPTSW